MVFVVRDTLLLRVRVGEIMLTGEESQSLLPKKLPHFQDLKSYRPDAGSKLDLIYIGTTCRLTALINIVLLDFKRYERNAMIYEPKSVQAMVCLF